MMKVANMLTDLRVPGREFDVRGAVTIWRAVCDHARLEEDWHRTIRTMMAMANRLTSPDRQVSMDDFRAAVHLWQAAYALCLERDEEQALRVVRTMMDVANHLSDFSGRVSDLQLRGAIAIWCGVAACSTLTEDRLRAIRTMMALAGKRIGAYSDHDSILAALRLWHAAYRCATIDEGRYRVVKTIMDLADKYPAICADAIDILRRERAAFDAPGFEIQVQAGLLYYQQEHRAVVSLAESAGRDAPVWVAALRAEAQRKLGEHREAIATCGELIARCGAPAVSRPQHEALVSALCCRGYCHLELGRSAPSSLPRAVKDLERALATAHEHGVPEPPRAHSGIGYVRQLQGRDDEAEEAFARARQLDADNLKAAAGTAQTASGADDDADPKGPEARRRALMSEARRLNELHNDVAGAIARWSDAHALRLPGEDSSAVVAIMMAVARKRSSADLAPEHRDVPGAVCIYEAVQALGISADQRQRVVRTMMAAAARFTDRALSADELDIDGAIALWRSVHSMADDDEERRRVTRVMRVVADRMESDETTKMPVGSRPVERLKKAIAAICQDQLTVRYPGV
jgi:tetratricopeptide (TPR) repeat protein